MRYFLLICTTIYKINAKYPLTYRLALFNKLKNLAVLRPGKYKNAQMQRYGYINIPHIYGKRRGICGLNAGYD
jgi:hypothetical protein